MRPPDFIIGDPARPYIRRWWLIPRNRFFNVYLHQILRDDDDRALHDHPWWNVSILLRGAYLEHVPDLKQRPTPHTRIADLTTVVKLRRAGQIVLRPATACHRLQLAPGVRECWSLFITGPRIREWGFHCPQGWRDWRVFTKPGDYGQTGRGCE